MGMRRARLEGKRIGREPMKIDRAQVMLVRQTMSLTQVARKNSISRASVCRIMKQVAVPVAGGLLYREAASNR
jgi:DNA invertase Pin-like site-specific DNA recombinase